MKIPRLGKISGGCADSVPVLEVLSSWQAPIDDLVGGHQGGVRQSNCYARDKAGDMQKALDTTAAPSVESLNNINCTTNKMSALVTLITGTSTGIGLATAVHLASLVPSA
jgi:hypothetical protein